MDGSRARDGTQGYARFGMLDIGLGKLDTQMSSEFLN